MTRLCSKISAEFPNFFFTRVTPPLWYICTCLQKGIFLSKILPTKQTTTYSQYQHQNWQQQIGTRATEPKLTEHTLIFPNTNILETEKHTFTVVIFKHFLHAYKKIVSSIYILTKTFQCFGAIRECGGATTSCQPRGVTTVALTTFPYDLVKFQNTVNDAIIHYSYNEKFCPRYMKRLELVASQQANTERDKL